MLKWWGRKKVREKGMISEWIDRERDRQQFTSSHYVVGYCFRSVELGKYGKPIRISGRVRSYGWVCKLLIKLLKEGSCGPIF